MRALAVIILLLLIYSTFITFQNFQYQKELTQIKSQLDSVEAAKNMLEVQLNLTQKEAEQCTEQLTNLSKAFTELQQKYNESVEESVEYKKKLEELLLLYENLSKNLKEIDESIKKQLTWFQENTMLPLSLEKMEEKCLDGNKLNSACISYYYLKNVLGLKYIGEVNDTLHSLDEILKMGGGDCEEFALIYAAVLRSYVGKKLSAWKEGKNEFPVYKEGRYVYYIPNAEKVEITIPDNISMICYYTYIDPPVYIGHCVVGVGTKLLEPQTGKYLGEIGKEFYLCNKTKCSENGITMILTPTNLIIWNRREWLNCQNLAEKLKETENEVNNTVQDLLFVLNRSKK